MEKHDQEMMFEMVNDLGETITCEVLFSYCSSYSGKYVFVYTDNTTDEEGRMHVYATYFDPMKENQLTDPVEDAEEWDEIMDRFEEISDELMSEEE